MGGATGKWNSGSFGSLNTTNIHHSCWRRVRRVWPTLCAPGDLEDRTGSQQMASPRGAAGSSASPSKSEEVKPPAVKGRGFSSPFIMPTPKQSSHLKEVKKAFILESSKSDCGLGTV